MNLLLAGSFDDAERDQWRQVLAQAMPRHHLVATGELFDRVYNELRRMAVAQVRDDAGAFSPTELVHEAYLRLFPEPSPAFAGYLRSLIA